MTSPRQADGRHLEMTARPEPQVHQRLADPLLDHDPGHRQQDRDHQQADGQWTRGKGYDTFCPLGPWIDTSLDPSDVELVTELDGEVKQRTRTSLMLHDVGEIVEWISRVMTLLPGDVILTGTPEGVGPMVAGQRISVTVDGIGTLSNPVVDK